MDIYRFFHPHHNPRLHTTPLRLQELSELLQVASELLKALIRAQRRCARKPIESVTSDRFTLVIETLKSVEYELHELMQSHPGDSRDEIAELIIERSQMNGWGYWAQLLGEQLKLWDEDPALPQTPIKDVVNR